LSLARVFFTRQPTARHAADLGIIPVVVEDACGAGHADAAQRSCEALHFAGDAIMTDTEAFCEAVGKAGRSQGLGRTAASWFETRGVAALLTMRVQDLTPRRPHP
jgi:Isochorismatase family